MEINPDAMLVIDAFVYFYIIFESENMSPERCKSETKITIIISLQRLARFPSDFDAMSVHRREFIIVYYPRYNPIAKLPTR